MQLGHLTWTWKETLEVSLCTFISQVLFFALFQWLHFSSIKTYCLQGCVCVWQLAYPSSHSSWAQSKNQSPNISKDFIFIMFRESWPKTPYVKSIGYWVLMCYLSVFYCLLEYCVVLTLKNPFTTNQIQNTMVPDNEEQGRIRIALGIEKYSRIGVSIYLFSFTLMYFIIMTM